MVAAGKRPFVVGLTGGIGSGKSEAAAAFARLGAEVVDADRLGHEALRDPEVMRQVETRFGRGVFNEGGQIDRRRLGALVFGSAEARRALEAVSHPYITRRAREAVAQTKAPLVVLDAALLLEAGWGGLCDAVVYVDAPDEVRLARVRGRSGWSEDELRARERAQMPLTDKRARANHVMENASTREHLDRQAEGLVSLWGLLPAGATTGDSPQ